MTYITSCYNSCGTIRYNFDRRERSSPNCASEASDGRLSTLDPYQLIIINEEEVIRSLKRLIGKMRHLFGVHILRAFGGIPEVFLWRVAGEFAEVVDEMRLIVVAAGVGDLG